MTDYLPKLATIEQACAWLNERTGKDWSLARLLEYGLMPWVWLEHAPGYPAIFGDRLEGYLAPMVFGGDTQRLAAGGTDALITMTRTGDGALMRINPGIPAPLSELRFKREDIEALAARSGTPEKKAPHGHGVPKEKIIDGFSLDNKNWLDLPAHPNSDGKHYKVIDLKQAAKALKRSKAGVMLLVAQSKLTAFVMAGGWKGNAYPTRDKYTHWYVTTDESFPDGSENRTLDCRETGESFSVRTFNACQMWALCHSNSYLLAIGHSRRIDADVLAPIDGQDFHLKHPECAPWKDFYFLADEPHLVTWNDLWFDEDEIQAIEHSAASGAPENNEPPQVRRDTKDFATTKQMAEAFPHPKGTKPENWKRTLSDPPAWLKDAREFPGGPGVSALWNPAAFALCMVSEGHISKQAALNIIRREFSDFLDEWENKASHL